MITEFELFEKYKLTPLRLYCIYNNNKPNSSFTTGKYYDIYSQSYWSTGFLNKKVIGEDLKVMNDNGILREVQPSSNDRRQYGWWLSIIKDIDLEIPLYVIWFSKIIFIKEEDVENFEMLNAAKKYNL